jgi:hypothetical protein
VKLDGCWSELEDMDKGLYHYGLRAWNVHTRINNIQTTGHRPPLAIVKEIISPCFNFICQQFI